MKALMPWLGLMVCVGTASLGLAAEPPLNQPNAPASSGAAPQAQPKYPPGAKPCDCGNCGSECCPNRCCGPKGCWPNLPGLRGIGKLFHHCLIEEEQGSGCQPKPVRPPNPPQISTPVFPTHPYAHGPRDYFMVLD